MKIRNMCAQISKIRLINKSWRRALFDVFIFNLLLSVCAPLRCVQVSNWNKDSLLWNAAEMMQIHLTDSIRTIRINQRDQIDPQWFRLVYAFSTFPHILVHLHFIWLFTILYIYEPINTLILSCYRLRDPAAAISPNLPPIKFWLHKSEGWTPVHFVGSLNLILFIL